MSSKYTDIELKTFKHLFNLFNWGIPYVSGLITNRIAIANISSDFQKFIDYIVS